MARKPAELAPIMTRIPERLRRRLEKEAAENGRSMNSEIIHRLESSFDLQDFFAKTLMLAFGQEIAEMLRRARLEAHAFFHNSAANVPGSGLIFWRDAHSQLRFRLLDGGAGDGEGGDE